MELLNGILLIIIRFSKAFNNRSQMKKIKRQTDWIAPTSTSFEAMQVYNNQILYKHPNQLFNILKIVPDNISGPHLSKAHRLRLVAMIGFCHPVMNKEAQQAIRKIIGSNCFWTIDQSLTLMLEILNIICLIPGINYKLLNLRQQPNIANDNYAFALWVNCLPALSHGQFFSDINDKIRDVKKQQALRVRQFTNNLIQLREKITKNVYHDKIQGQKETEKHYHDLDIILANQGIVTLDYFPEDYSQQYLQLWVDRTVELNSLLGNFVCKQKFGEFEYIRGPLLYAMQQGILLVLNNFSQVSNELLVSLKALSGEGKITLNQKTIRANAGFRMVGILSTEKSSKSRSAIARLIDHYPLPAKNYEDIIPKIENQQNREYISKIFQDAKDLGYLGLKKLWKRIQRLREKIIHLSESDEPERGQRLWNSFFTQQFMDNIQLQISDLTNKNQQQRIINYQQKYRAIVIGRTQINFNYQPLLKIVKTQYSLKVLEKLAVCFQVGEYPLLISETGCGKTTLVQYLAELSGHKLYVYNMSSGTDVTDLIGGFKPIDCRVLLRELFNSYIEKFRAQVPGASKNEGYLINLTNYLAQGRIQVLLRSLVQSIPKIIPQLNNKGVGQWQDLLRKFTNILGNLDRIDSNLVFSFLEGNLIKALRNGDWILIDQINLATNDVLQKIVPLIQGKSLMLYEKGDLTYLTRHPDFRIVACMNPANDSGKKSLPPNLAQKFTSIMMSDPSRPDIEMMTKEICPQLNPQDVSDIYFIIKKTRTISLRNLSRALAYINRNKEVYGWGRSVYDGLMLGFGEKQLLKVFLNESVPKPTPGMIEIEGFLLAQGPYQQQKKQIFHLTQVFKGHLKDFLRAIAGTELPVLLEGPTSAGKTSMIRYVAQTVGYKCIRINNHEHTQIQQYIGNYFPDKTGRLVFREGPLVQAVREGYWLILDQLNLAKTEILQCLNRLLDDNRELFIPEQQKHIKPHHNFRIFATQNPSSYSGRKTLSRAFRNRFVGISFADITTQDTMAILEARSPLLKDSKDLSSFVRKTLENLSNYRQRQRVFEKDGLVTIRNLLKWCERKYISKEKFAVQGYAILAEKLRNQQQKKFVEKVLLTSVKSSVQQVHREYFATVQQQFSEQNIQKSGIYVQMNESFKRMAALTLKAVGNKQPVLLVGETGCGKTTLAELLAALSGRKFFSINCHKHMEASDLLGSLRPAISPDSQSKFEFVNGVVIDAMLQGGILLIDEINTAEDSVLQRLNQVLECGLVGIQRGQGWQTVQAKEGFCIIATMNPSGDYGKKELSPALRNRFTEIWVQPITHPQFIRQAKEDILKMIKHKLSFEEPLKSEISNLIYDFLVRYNCDIALRYNLTRKLLTMRDIGWICKFINDCQFPNWRQKYFWSIVILAVQGVKYIMTDNVEGGKLEGMKQQLLALLIEQVGVESDWISRTGPEHIVGLIKNMNFPLLIKTSTPLEVLGIVPDEKIFFSPQTDLSDLLGQYRPHGSDFVWHDESLLRCVKNGGIAALIDLNMAQQQVIQGINSLFDHRGSLFVVQLNRLFHKAPNFKPVVVLRNQTGQGRKGLPNSFLNRFVKLSIPNVEKQVKIAYLTKKYTFIAQYFELLGLIRVLLEKQPNITVENIEFIIQFAQNGLLNQALQILQLGRYRVQNIQSKFSQYQSQILQLFPLRKSYGIINPQYTKTLVLTVLIYRYSKFNICLVGSNKIRTNMAKALAYLLNHNFVKILISTMIDINDLLGTYEQISANQAMDVEQTLSSTIFSTQDESKFKSQETKFVFIESQIVKCLRDSNNIVFIEVPNDAIAERIQKGIKEVYNLQKKIIIGIDSACAKKSTITKFITLNIQHDHIDGQVSIQNTYSAFPENQTSLVSSDLRIRQQQTRIFISEAVNQQSQLKAMTAWRRLLDYLCNKSLKEEQRMKQEILEKIRRQYLQKYRVSLIENQSLQQRMKKTISKVQIVSTKQAFMNKLMLQSFFTGDPHHLSKKLSFFSEQQENLSKIITKFQVLYSCNINNFKQTAKTIMPILFKQDHNSPIAKKYFKQIERLYEQLFKFKIKETLIQFNEEEHKLIPIINNIESVRYQLYNQHTDVSKLCNEGTHYDHILDGLQKVIIECVKAIEVDIGSVGKWCKQLKIKHLGALQLFQASIGKKITLLENILQTKQVSSFLHELSLEINQTSTLQIGLSLFSIFKPSTNMNLNISYHLKNEMRAKYIKELIADDEQFVKKYNHLSLIKYFNYKPQQLKILASKLKGHTEQFVSVQKLLLYRGHNNIESLIEFYEKLQHYTLQIQSSNFDKEVIRKVIIQTFHGYYHIFSDILLPYYIPLIIIYQHEIPKEQSISAELITKNKSDLVEMIDSLIAREDVEVDRSKDYLRFQKKFNRTVIIDQYTEEGVEKNKQIIQQQFAQLFGKSGALQTVRVQSPFEKVYMLINKTKQSYYPYLSKLFINNINQYSELVIGLQILLKFEQKNINIYDQYNPYVIKMLVEPLPTIMSEIHDLINKYPIDNIKNLANICNKIEQRSLYEEIYKILIDCEFLIEKIFEVNSILPMADHIKTDKIIQNCLRIRRLQLTNWKTMIDLKVRRTQISDMIQFVELYRSIREIRNQRQLFALCQKYLSQSKLSCLDNRIRLLLFIKDQGLLPNNQSYRHVLYRVLGFYQYIIPDISLHKSTTKRQKEQEMRQYQKLAGWNSNEYLIFKATCEKFQRKIHHILKRYDQELSMTVATFHQQILSKQFHETIKDFRNGLEKLLQVKYEIEQQQIIEDEDEDNGQQKQPKQQKKQDKQQIMIEEKDESEMDEYQLINKRIFTSLKELQEQHHNNQSKLLIIRAYLAQLEEFFRQFTISSKSQYKYLKREQFTNDDDYKRAVKYYYGLWDKLCQRAETSWNREVIDRLWHVSQKIWVHINKELRFAEQKNKDELAEDLRVLYSDFIQSQKSYHPLFNDQLQKVKTYIDKQDELQRVVILEEQFIINPSLINLMKLGYILGNIAVNLQKNGLCAKEEHQQGEKSENQEIGDGMGIGQAQAHSAAENVGDEIQFQEQIMGHKDEQKNQKDNANKKQQNDIQMQGDFEGQMYSKEQEEQQDGQGKSQSVDEQMGDVDQKQKQQDMKNEAGQAEGQGEADVDIKNQQQGEQELIDNERQQKEERKGEDKRNNQQEQGQDQKSDWDENNEEGEKINKQKEDVAAEEQSASFDCDKKDQIEDIEQSQSGEVGEQDKQEQKNEQIDQEGQQNDEEPEQANGQGEGQKMQQQENSQIQQDQAQQKEKEKKGRQSKQYNPAYGRNDINTNNQVLNDDEQPAQQANNQGNKQQGKGQGDQSSGDPIHNLSSDFLQEILRQQRSEGNEQFVKDLNVLMNDQNEPAQEQAREGQQQFQLTQEKDKFATNLPLLDDQKMVDEKQEQKAQKQEKKKQERQENQPQKGKKQKENQQKPDKSKNQQKSGKNQKKTDHQKNQQAIAAQQKYNQAKNNINAPKNQEKIEKQMWDEDEQKQKLIKKALQTIKIEDKQIPQTQKDKKLLSQSFQISKILEQQLKSVLEPMDNAQYRGDFKTGKKLNLKKIIPFIASNYRKDRIWLRRTEPSERNYYVMIGLDDTKSMHYGDVGQQALKGLLAISMALQHLSIKTNVCSIRDDMVVLKKFGDILDSQKIMNNFQFHYESSNSHDLSMASFMKSSLQVFKNVEEQDMNVQVKKLCFIISDGKMNKKLVQPFMKDVKKEDITYVFIIVDSQQSSILNIKSVQYGENKKMRIKSYMADFPFEYFLIINDVKQLGEILAMTLMQFIQEK